MAARHVLIPFEGKKLTLDLPANWKVIVELYL